MRTPKRLYAQQRTIYQPELLTCPHCGDLLVMCNYLAWDKTVQTLDQVLSVTSGPGHCPHVTCAGSGMRLLSAQAQRLAPPGSTYGYDVLVRIAWWHQEYRATYREIHTELASRLVFRSPTWAICINRSIYRSWPATSAAPRPPGADCQRAWRLDYRPRWPGTPRRRAANLVHP